MGYPHWWKPTIDVQLIYSSIYLTVSYPFLWYILLFKHLIFLIYRIDLAYLIKLIQSNLSISYLVSPIPSHPSLSPMYLSNLVGWSAHVLSCTDYFFTYVFDSATQKRSSCYATLSIYSTPEKRKSAQHMWDVENRMTLKLTQFSHGEVLSQPLWKPRAVATPAAACSQDLGPLGIGWGIWQRGDFKNAKAIHPNWLIPYKQIHYFSQNYD